MERLKILIVDDEKEIADLVEIYLSNEGYEVLKAYNAKDAINLLDTNDVQLIILDIMMPGMDGLEACRTIRKTRNIPIIMLSAKSEDMDKILGLSNGADDYLTKPFNPLELAARVKSQLRRFLYLNPQGTGIKDKGQLCIDGLVIDPESHTVVLYENEVSLTPIEFEILYLLAVNRGRVFGAEEIFEKVWKEQYFESNNTVMVHIRKIREKIEDDPRRPKYIKTVWGVGYKIEK
ncbi:MAG: response regulator transcription factor [Bacillota bacterium]|nr:response regulator transcription factor [Bacillota bacterium]